MVKPETKRFKESFTVTKFLFFVLVTIPLGIWLRTGFEEDWGWSSVVSRLVAALVVIGLNLVFIYAIGRYERKQQAGKKS